MKTKKQFKSGFTLVELIIVIAIIGILASAVMVAVNPGKRTGQARDAQRRKDISEIATALQVYNTKKGEFPKEDECDSSIGQDGTPGGCTEQTSNPGNNWDTTGPEFIYNQLVYEVKIMKLLPLDPKNNSTYYYRYEPSHSENQLDICPWYAVLACEIFWIGARLESVEPGKEGKMVYRCTNDTSLDYDTGCQVVEFLNATGLGSFDETFIGVTKR